MKRQALIKTIAGALFTGVSLLNSNAMLMTIAGRLNIKWISEGLAFLAEGLSPPLAGSALALAHARALRSALSTLQNEYWRTFDSLSNGEVFLLLTESANSLVWAEVSLPKTPRLEDIEQDLADTLPGLLKNYDERQVVWLQLHLLPTVARSFQAELKLDPEARQTFSWDLLQQIARHSKVLGIAAKQLLPLLDFLSTTSSQLDTIHCSQSTLETQLAQWIISPRRKAVNQSSEISNINEGGEIEITKEDLPINLDPPPQASITHSDDRNVQIIFRTFDSHLQSIEINRSTDIFLNVSIARREGEVTVSLSRVGTDLPPEGRLSILALFADPAPRYEPLDLLREVRALEDAIHPYEEKFHLRTIKAATVDDLCRELRDQGPELLHLAGHGTSEGFRFCDALGDEQFARWVDLAEEIAEHVPPLRAVIIASCHATEAAHLRAPYIIAMQGSLADEVSVVFCQGFYEALVAAPTNIQRAYESGRRRARLKLRCDNTALPVLHRNAVV